MTEIEALTELKNFFDKVENSMDKDNPYYGNILVVQKIIDSEFSKDCQKYSTVRNFLLKMLEQDPTSTLGKRLPSLEELQEQNSVEKYWSYP